MHPNVLRREINSGGIEQWPTASGASTPPHVPDRCSVRSVLLAADQSCRPLLGFTFLNDNLVALLINSLQLSSIGKSEAIILVIGRKILLITAKGDTSCVSFFLPR
jgi:hypothetical protein